ncbi:MAG: PDZ domain-containing protein [Phycisphaerae bacterium]|nr:PDZ domain-containing protein [Phycisphaerae bacterium]
MFLSLTRVRPAAGLLALLVVPLATASVARAAWMGVQLQPVPSSLAAHVDLPDGGLLVENVMRGGPADRAGLDRWDIITAVDGQPVPSDLGALTTIIQNKAAGDTMIVSYIHAGQPQTATVTLDERPDSLGESEWKHALEPRDILQERVSVSGHTLAKDEKGNWILKSILDLPGAVPLPSDLEDLFQGVTTEVIVSNDEAGNRVCIAREGADGERIEVNIQGDEPIRVRRTKTVAGQESTTEQTYADMDALREADPDVHELLSGSQGRGVLKIGPSGPIINPRILKLEGMVGMDEKLERSGQALADYLSRMSRQLGSCTISLGDKDAMTVGPHCFYSSEKASFAFRVQPDGQIEVTRRVGDSDLTDVYRDEADLKTRDPAMYERYQGLRSPVDPAKQP